MTFTDSVTVPCTQCGAVHTWETKDSLCTCTQCGHHKCFITDVNEYIGHVRPSLVSHQVTANRHKMAFFDMTPHDDGNGVKRGEGPPDEGRPPKLPWWDLWGKGGPVQPGP